MKKATLILKSVALLSILNILSGYTQTITLNIWGQPPHFRGCDTAIAYQYGVLFSYSGCNIGDTIYFKTSSTNGINIPSFYVTDGSTGSLDHIISHKFRSYGAFDLKCLAFIKNGAKDSLELYNALVLKDSCYIVSGRIYTDLNNNCIYDNGENPLKSFLVIGNNQANNYFSYCNADSNGYYRLPVTKNIDPISFGTGFLTNCPLNINYDNFYVTADTSGVDFAVKRQLSIMPYNNATTDIYCKTPAYISISPQYQFAGFDLGASAPYKVLFGDGKDTTINIDIGSDVQDPIYFRTVYFNHSYQMAGSYTPIYIITNPVTGILDTSARISPIIVYDSCTSIIGTVFLDINSDCAFSTNEYGLNNQKVQLINGYQTVEQAYTDSSGSFFFGIPTDSSTSKNYKIKYVDQKLTTACAADSVRILNVLPASAINFAVACKQGYDLTGTVSGWGFRPGFKGYIYVNAQNNRCESVNATIKLIKSAVLRVLSTYPPVDATFGDTLVWYRNNFTNTDKFFADIEVETNVNAYEWDSLVCKLLLLPTVSDSMPIDNNQTYTFPIKNSWDPNMKLASVNGDAYKNTIAPDTKVIDYTIFFQNTGNAEAINISIMDTLDKSINPTSVEILSSSHSMTANILQGNILKFTFKNIMLLDSATNEPASHGFVSYKVHLKDSLPIGTNIKNTAHIYFDFNPAVVTNTTESVLTEPTGIVNRTKTFSIHAYPNPANNELSIVLPQEALGGTINMVDILGNIVLKTTVNGSLMKIKTAEFSTGLYLIQVSKGNALYKSKISIVH